MKRIALVGFTGWAGIVWLAWTFANNRIDACRYSEGWTCELRARAARDATLTNGLTVALVGLLAIMFMTLQSDRRVRLSRMRPIVPASLEFVRQRRWLIGVAVAAALSSVIWLTVRPWRWLVTEIAPADTATFVASDAVTDAYAIGAPAASAAEVDAPADVTANGDAIAAGSVDPQSADDEPASAPDEAGDAVGK